MTESAGLRETLSELVQVSSRLIQAVRRLARESGSGGSADSVASWRTLGVLQRSGPLRVGELADASQVAQPTMTKLVAGLVDRGFAERLPDPDDARAWRIGVTADGLRELEAWRDAMASDLEPHFAHLDPEDVDALDRTVQLLHARLEQIGAPSGDKKTPLERQE